MPESFASFLQRHRFAARDILSRRNQTSHDFEIAALLGGWQILKFDSECKSLRNLGSALLLANYMINFQTDQPEPFSRAISELTDDEWMFALRFCPFHRVDTAIKNLELIQNAMEEACLGANTASAGMEFSFESSRSSPDIYKREQSKATTQIINFTALYASYIDVCRRIRDDCGLKGKESYDRAISRIKRRNRGAHDFTKELRNFLLHYQIVEPSIQISYGANRSAQLYLETHSILYSGFKWKTESRLFLQKTDKVDVIQTLKSVTEDIHRLVRFHRKLVAKRLPYRKFAYESYTNERARLNHLQRATLDIGAAFKKPKSLIKRTVDDEFVQSVIQSALTDEDATALIVSFANRHYNFSSRLLGRLNMEVRELLAHRPRYPVGVPYLQGQKIE